ARLVDRVLTAQERGDVAGGDAVQLATFLWASCHGMISLELDGVGTDSIDWDELYRNGVRTALRGLQPAATARRAS
ncbi:MAG: TetR-like C-terminal domain-containing protein, partial [Acidimicrobiia bacterium]